MRLAKAQTFVAVAALFVLLTSAGNTNAQGNKKNGPTGDIKPAQTDSSGAHPVTPTNKEGAAGQASDRSDNDRRANTNARNRTDAPRRETSSDDRNNEDSDLNSQVADCLLNKNRGEVELGKYAVKHAKNSSVKEFAQQMVKDHSKVVDKLERIVGSREPNDKRSQIARAIDEECLDSLKKELADKSEKEFDACYVGSQISGHMQMAAALKVLSDHTSGDLAEVVKEARPVVDKHLTHAKKLMEELDKSSRNTQAAKGRSERSR